MNSIRKRLTIGLIAGCCVLWCIGGAALYLAARAGLLAEFDGTLKAKAQALASLTEHVRGRLEFDFTDEFMPSFDQTRLPDYFELWLPNGTVIERSHSLKDDDLPRQAGPLDTPHLWDLKLPVTGSTPAAARRAVDTPHLWDLKLPDGGAGRAIGVRFIPRKDDELIEGAEKLPPHDPTSELTLVIASPRAEMDQRLHSIGIALLLVGGLLAVGTGFLVPVIVRKGLAPLVNLGERAAQIEATSLELRFPTDGMPAELLPICKRLNELLSRLETSFERERRFSADVAHELRTPIAELRSLAEVAIAWPDDAPATARALQDALDIAVQMETIATGLLTLARCEAGQQPITRQPVALAPLVKEILQPLAEQSRRKEMAVTVHIPEDASWQTDPVLFRAILTNVLCNAVEYSPRGGSMQVYSAMDDGQRRLQVSNETDILLPDDLPHLFERFWRKDPARSSSHHSGLGLALTKAFAEMLGMKITAILTTSTTLTLCLEEP